jgi:hypothetical protein
LLSIRETDRRQFMKSQAGRSAWIPTELLREFVRHPVDRLLDRGDILSRPAIFPGLDQAEIGGGRRRTLQRRFLSCIGATLMSVDEDGDRRVQCAAMFERGRDHGALRPFVVTSTE